MNGKLRSLDFLDHHAVDGRFAKGEVTAAGFDFRRQVPQGIRQLDGEVMGICHVFFWFFCISSEMHFYFSPGANAGERAGGSRGGGGKQSGHRPVGTPVNPTRQHPFWVANKMVER